MVFTIHEDTLEITEALDDLNDQFSALGYESAFSFTNFGSLILVLFAQIVLIPVFICIWKCSYCHNKLRNTAKKQVKGCFFNGILTFIDGTLLVLLIVGFINLNLNNKGDVEKDDSYYLALAALIICGLELVLFPLFLFVKFR